MVLACMAPGTLCNEAEAWGPRGGQQQAALPSLASFKPHVSLSREGLVLVVVPCGPHPNTGLKQGWALLATIPLMLGGSGRRILPFSRAFCPEHLPWCLGVPAPRLWLRDFLDAGCQEPASCPTCPLQNSGQHHGRRAARVSVISVFADRFVCSSRWRAGGVGSHQSV